MRKKLLLAIAMLISVASFAQKKGDMFFSGTLSTDFGTFVMSSSEDGYSTSEREPLSTWFEAGVDYGYFVADNFRLSLSMSVPISSYTFEKDENDKWLKNTSTSIIVSPNAAYYVKLAEKLYYTPEVGVMYGYCKSKDRSILSGVETSYESSWGVYLSFLALEFKASDRIAISTFVGGIEYESSKYSYENSDIKDKVNIFSFSLNSATVAFRLYF